MNLEPLVSWVLKLFFVSNNHMLGSMHFAILTLNGVHSCLIYVTISETIDILDYVAHFIDQHSADCNTFVTGSNLSMLVVKMLGRTLIQRNALINLRRSSPTGSNYQPQFGSY